MLPSLALWMLSTRLTKKVGRVHKGHWASSLSHGREPPVVAADHEGGGFFMWPPHHRHLFNVAATTTTYGVKPQMHEEANRALLLKKWTVRERGRAREGGSNATSTPSHDYHNMPKS